MSEAYDVCVIGGGIQGCGVAQAAAAAGYSVMLLEKTALASATSSRSSKLIHGGLRYLETAQFSLVRESLYERELLLKNAPELVHRVPFYIPVYKQTSRSAWQIFTGLSLYALLGGLRATASFRRIPQQDWDHLDGLLRRDLGTVFEYFDAQTDDRRLTEAVMYSACELGANWCCPAEVTAVRLQQAGKAGYEVEYQTDSNTLTLSCKTLVNACGPWVTKVQQRIRPQVSAPPIELVQGSHIVMRQPAPRAVYYVESPGDKRAVFIMPWYGQTLVGTTEKIYKGDPAKVEADDNERNYLQGIFRHYFPQGDTQIASDFAGVRVLPATENSPFRRPRDTLFFHHVALPGYLALMGGKLTGYRSAAQTALRQLQSFLPSTRRVLDTRHIKLAPARF